MSGVRPLPGDELPMPAKQRVRSYDGHDLPQPSTAQPIRPHGESAPIGIGQPQASTTQLPAKHTILFEQIPKDFSLLAVQPTGQQREQQLERGDVYHGRSLYHGPPVLTDVVDPVVGHYEVNEERDRSGSRRLTLPAISAQASAHLERAYPDRPARNFARPVGVLRLPADWMVTPLGCLISTNRVAGLVPTLRLVKRQLIFFALLDHGHRVDKILAGDRDRGGARIVAGVLVDANDDFPTADGRCRRDLYPGRILGRGYWAV